MMVIHFGYLAKIFDLKTVFLYSVIKEEIYMECPQGIENVVLDMNKLVFKIEPAGNANKLWEIVYFSNSDYTGDPVSKRISSGFILYVLVVPVSW